MAFESKRENGVSGSPTFSGIFRLDRTYAFRPFSLREKVGMRGWKRKFLHFIPLTLSVSLGRGNRKHFCVSPDSIYTVMKHAPSTNLSAHRGYYL
jgi:hypothetical protein